MNEDLLQLYRNLSGSMPDAFGDVTEDQFIESVANRSKFLTFADSLDKDLQLFNSKKDKEAFIQRYYPLVKTPEQKIQDLKNPMSGLKDLVTGQKSAETELSDTSSELYSQYEQEALAAKKAKATSVARDKPTESYIPTLTDGEKKQLATKARADAFGTLDLNPDQFTETEMYNYIYPDRMAEAERKAKVVNRDGNILVPVAPDRAVKSLEEKFNGINLEMTPDELLKTEKIEGWDDESLLRLKTKYFADEKIMAEEEFKALNLKAEYLEKQYEGTDPHVWSSFEILNKAVEAQKSGQLDEQLRQQAIEAQEYLKKVPEDEMTRIDAIRKSANELQGRIGEINEKYPGFPVLAKMNLAIQQARDIKQENTTWMGKALIGVSQSLGEALPRLGEGVISTYDAVAANWSEESEAAQILRSTEFLQRATNRDATVAQRPSLTDRVFDFKHGDQIYEISVDQDGQPKEVYNKYGNVARIDDTARRQILKDAQAHAHEAKWRPNGSAFFNQAADASSDLMGTIAMAIPTGGLGSGAVMARLREFVPIMLQYTGRTAQEGLKAGLDTEQAMWYGIAGSTMEGLTEVIFPFIGRITGKAEAVAVRNAVKRVALNTDKEALKRLGTKELLGEVVIAPVGEGAEESLAEVLQPLIDQGFNNYVGDDLLQVEPASFGSVTEAFTLGAAISLIPGFVGGIRSSKAIQSDQHLAESVFSIVNNWDKAKPLFNEFKLDRALEPAFEATRRRTLIDLQDDTLSEEEKVKRVAAVFDAEKRRLDVNAAATTPHIEEIREDFEKLDARATKVQLGELEDDIFKETETFTEREQGENVNKEGTNSTKTGENVNPLQNVESTAKSFGSVLNKHEDVELDEEFSPEKQEALHITFELLPKNIREEVENSEGKKGYPQAVAEEYHKAKSDNSNPALVEAVEKLLAPKTGLPSEEEVARAFGENANHKSQIEETIPIERLLRPDGAIGTQGITEEQTRGVLENILGLTIPKGATMREMVDLFLSDKDNINKLIEFTRNNPIDITELPDGTIQINDGHHRAFLLNQAGVKDISIKGKTQAKEETDNRKSQIEDIEERRKEELLGLDNRDVNERINTDSTETIKGFIGKYETLIADKDYSDFTETELKDRLNLYQKALDISIKYDAELEAINQQQPEDSKSISVQGEEKSTSIAVQNDLQLTERQNEAQSEPQSDAVKEITDTAVINKAHKEFKTKLGEKKTKTYFDRVNKLFPPERVNVVQYRTNGVVTKEGNKYTFHALADLDMKKWRVAFTNDVTDQFTPVGEKLTPKETTKAPEKTEPKAEVKTIRNVAPKPKSYRDIQVGQVVKYDGRDWKVLVRFNDGTFKLQNVDNFREFASPVDFSEIEGVVTNTEVKDTDIFGQVSDVTLSPISRRAFGVLLDRLRKALKIPVNLIRDSDVAALLDSNTKRQQTIQESNAVFYTRDGKPIGFNYNTDKVARERFDLGSLKKIGEGSDRVVFDMGDGKVLKVAKSPRGLEQNIYEGDFFLFEQGITPETYERGLNYVVQEKLEKPSHWAHVPVYDVETGKQTGVSTLTRMMSEFSDYNQKDFDNRVDGLQDVLAKYGFQDVLNYDLLWGDFASKRNWGVKNERAYHVDGGTFGGTEMLTSRPTTKEFKPLQYGMKNVGFQEAMKDEEFREVYNRSRKAKKEFQDKDKYTRFRNKQGLVYGFVKDNQVYLNIDKMNSNTPIHEFGHVWISVMSKLQPRMISAGKALVANTRYMDEVRNNPAYDNLSEDEKLEEALASAIGDKGEQILRAASKVKFMSWYRKFWIILKSAMGRFAGRKLDKIKPELFDEMTLDEFSALAVGELLGGKEIESESEQKVPENGTVSKQSKQLLAPNGKPSNLTPEQHAQVRTPEFARFFGDLFGNRQKVTDNFESIIKALNIEKTDC